MARKRKNKGRGRQPQPPANLNSGGGQAAGGREKTSREIERLGASAESYTTVEDRRAAEESMRASPDLSLGDQIAEAKRLRYQFEALEARARKEEAAAKAKQDELDEALAGLRSDREDVERRLANAAEVSNSAREAKRAADARERELQEREEKLLEREFDADAGFARRNRRSLEGLEREAQILRDELSGHRARMAGERASIEKEANARAEQWKAETGKREEELRAGEAGLRKERQRMEVEREILSEDREAVEAKAERIAAARLENKDGEIRALEERLKAARGERDALEGRIREREDADRRFDGLAPEEVFAKLRDLQRERDGLNRELGSRPSAEAQQRLEELERRSEEWETERRSLHIQVAELKQDVVRRKIAVTELEALRDQKAALEASNDLLTNALEEEIRRIKDLVSGADGRSPFPSCSAMDSDGDLQAAPATTDQIVSLKSFAEYVRHRMANDPVTEKPLYYSASDVRSFIGGLAMSRLHLLQGISGTGKTSLPQAFARAVGAGCELIEVQAGWRDRQDLIGHFNTFEGRFHESEFLQALYRAGCPRYRETLFIVVLDEMNLSHPEQYFADLLSALEQEPRARRLVLMTAAVEQAPERMAARGRTLPIPANVWFVGTANHDETTKDFADKTYDRAHVMELPRHRDEFDIKESRSIQPVGIDALQHAFERATHDHAEEAEKAYDFLDRRLGEVFRRKFGVGWGNRLQRQMGHYVPVVIDCGGSIGEATDHVLATKLLRKIRDRHDNRPEDIVGLRDRIKEEWQALDRNRGPSRSIEILAEELHRLGHDED